VSVAPARRAALAVLKRVREREAFGAETLDTVIRASGLAPKDTALATRLAYGALETQGTLDAALDRFLTRPGDVEPAVRDVLRLAAYELLYARTPARAVVNEGVEAVKAVRKQAAGLANAVLRRLAEAAPAFPWGDPATDDAALALATAHPAWIVDMWIRELGRERAVAALQADLEPAPLYLWHVPFAGSFVEAMAALEDDGAGPVPDVPPGCILAADAQAAVRGRALADGRVLVCDAAAQLAAFACGSHPGGTVVDVAAGRGTKTAQLQARAVAAGEPASVFALDIHPFKAGVLARRMERLGVPCVTALVGDATRLDAVEGLPPAGTVDAVLVDAPCTGLGALRRHPEKRWRLEPDDVARLADLQLRMLVEAARLVRVGGRVVYSTCTVSGAENHGVVDAFLSREMGAFRTADISDVVPAQWRNDIGPEGWFQSLPRHGGPDGHFVAALVRSE
jgi:16S rRNA (cytosine967-C5)-methyltransferase